MKERSAVGTTAATHWHHGLNARFPKGHPNNLFKEPAGSKDQGSPVEVPWRCRISSGGMPGPMGLARRGGLHKRYQWSWRDRAQRSREKTACFPRARGSNDAFLGHVPEGNRYFGPGEAP